LTLEGKERFFVIPNTSKKKKEEAEKKGRYQHHLLQEYPAVFSRSFSMLVNLKNLA
jgi:hypothetical protein